MPRTMRLPCLVLLLALAASPARAQVAGHPVEVGGGGGVVQYDGRDHIKSGFAGTASIGYRWSPGLTFEAAWLNSPTELDATHGSYKHSFSWTGFDVRWNLRDPSEKFTPFLLTGYGFGRSHTPDLVEYSGRGAAALGAGVVMNIMGKERAALRLQVRDMLMKEPNSDEHSNHIAVTAALQFSFRGKSKDQDLDGVRNWLDECPNTPVGAKVDAKGCPIDSDKDGVFDGLDKCEDTPVGAKVDKNGCPTDADGDGVADGIDVCDSTAKGAIADAKGCPQDSDGDGVFDGLDQCPNTPKGALVDAKGCPLDADGDGVADGMDQCPNTPAGLQVLPNGCPIEVTEKETQLLDQGVIRLQNINFDFNKASIKPESFPLLDEVAAILIQYPTLNLEIGGHTDNTGKKQTNLKLSEQRAKSVLNYLLQKFPTMDASHFTSVGYGAESPVASNATSLGRAKNRRVEFRVTNAAELKVEREKRRFLRKDEPVPTPTPADTTKR